MPAKLKPQKFEIHKCTKGCSLNPQNFAGKGGALVHQWYEEGSNDATIRDKGKVMGFQLSLGAIARHRAHHLVRVDYKASAGDGVTIDPTKAEESTKRKSDLDVLEMFISRGADQIDLSTMRVSGEQLLRAIELKHKLTQGSVFESFFEAIGAAGDEMLIQEPGETKDVAASVDEQRQAAIAE